MTATTHLRSLQALEMAIRKGSFKVAAGELGITPAALGQRVKALEDYLGLDLLVRGRSGIRPTAELEVAVAHLGAAFRELDTVCRLLDFQRVQEIHIAADSDWADLWLRPRLDRFRKDNPNTLFCINGVGDVPVRLGQADCEIRFGGEGAEGSEEMLFRDYLLPVSSPENTARISQQAANDILEGFPLLHLDCYTQDGGAIGWEDWIRRFGHRKTVAGRGIRYRKVIHALEAVLAGAGLIVCGLALVKPRIDDGSLSKPFPIAEGAWSDSAYRVCFNDRALGRANTGLFRDWLLAEARKTEQELGRLVPPE